MTLGEHAGEHHQEEKNKSKFMRKAEEAPFVPLSIAGLLGAVAWKAYQYKNRGNMSTSVYLMHLRVQAQAMVVGGMTIGVSYFLLKDLWKKHHPIEVAPEAK